MHADDSQATWIPARVRSLPYALVLLAVRQLVALAAESSFFSSDGPRQARNRILEWLIEAAQLHRPCSEWWCLFGDAQALYSDPNTLDYLLAKFSDVPSVPVAVEVLHREVHAFTEIQRSLGFRSPVIDGPLLAKFAFDAAVQEDESNYRARAGLCDALERLTLRGMNAFYDILQHNEALLALVAGRRTPGECMAADAALARNARIKEMALTFKPAPPLAPKKRGRLL
jgi:hypothetical protein